MPEHDDSTRSPVNIDTKAAPDASGGEVPDATAMTAEDSIPPEQPSMDDAAGRPQAGDGDAPMPGARPIEGGSDLQSVHPGNGQRVEEADRPMDLDGSAPEKIGDPRDPTAGRAESHTSEANPR